MFSCSFYDLRQLSVTSNDQITYKPTLSTTYFDSPYPFPTATEASGKISSGTGPFLVSQPWLTPIDDMKKNLTGRSSPKDRSSSFRVPDIWLSNEERGRLTLTVQAPWTTTFNRFVSYSPVNFNAQTFDRS